jgi:cytochrome oxidase Cu insertion factor (SCO1/SenC/PrrC family)
MTRTFTSVLLAIAVVAGLGAAPAPSLAQATPLEAGVVAPDFTLPGATRHGMLAEPISLRDYEGKTVVLAFFFRARTRG